MSRSAQGETVSAGVPPGVKTTSGVKLQEARRPGIRVVDKSWADLTEGGKDTRAVRSARLPGAERPERCKQATSVPPKPTDPALHCTLWWLAPQAFGARPTPQSNRVGSGCLNPEQRSEHSLSPFPPPFFFFAPASGQEMHEATLNHRHAFS